MSTNINRVKLGTEQATHVPAHRNKHHKKQRNQKNPIQVLETQIKEPLINLDIKLTNIHIIVSEFFVEHVWSSQFTDAIFFKMILKDYR
jgi:hypothetical protein